MEPTRVLLRPLPWAGDWEIGTGKKRAVQHGAKPLLDAIASARHTGGKSNAENHIPDEMGFKWMTASSIQPWRDSLSRFTTLQFSFLFCEKTSSKAKNFCRGRLFFPIP